MKTKYDYKEVETNRYNKWLASKSFNADRMHLKPYTVVIPPPNVTGKLHLGHAWDNTLQDIVVRRKRMQGYNALFLPGMDHAGIATQAVVEAKLRKDGISRYDLGRDKFLNVAWEWKDEYATHIRNQWAALGLSLDYTKERFTLDEGLNDAVNEVFIKMYEMGLIYRGNRIISWDVEAKTALSNIEVEHEETIAKLYYINYPFKEGDGYLTVATTRPETMFADQAVMVHPEDERFNQYVGREVYIAGTNVLIPVIADSYVDKDFGTGVVKVTPAHDANDFEVGVRHNLEMPLCMNEDGTMNEMAFEFEGMDRMEVRDLVIKKLDKLGLLSKIEDYETSLGYSERTGVLVESRLSLQWFVKMDEISKDALNTEVEFVPSRFKKIYNNWMTDTLDWTISRQLWWGHRIPAWYKGDDVRVQIESPGKDWVQDEDVLDTWFSSALWPFSTLGFPKETSDYKTFYPTDLLVTGYDIIFFWVARMIFQGRLFTKKDPFKHVLLHGLIRDEKGRKMSKSLGNGVDPMDVIDEYGVDALRYFLTTNSAPGQDLRYSEEKVEASWNFINKLWNISRFVLMNLKGDETNIDFEELNGFDAWILTRLSETIKIADENYERFNFNEASHHLYNFIWNDFADWYLELAKVNLESSQTRNILAYILEAILKLLHPFIPFVTDSIYENFKGVSIIREAWPTLAYTSDEEVANFEIFKDLVIKVRNLKATHSVAPSKALKMEVITNSYTLTKYFKNHFESLEKFLVSSELSISKETTLDNTITIVGNNVTLEILKEDLIDRDAELAILNKQKETLEAEIKRSEKMLANDNFIKRANPEKVQAEKDKYQKYLNQYEELMKAINE